MFEKVAPTFWESAEYVGRNTRDEQVLNEGTTMFVKQKRMAARDGDVRSGGERECPA